MNSKVTIGALVPPVPLSKFCSGFLMSVPRSAKWSFMTNHAALLASFGLSFVSYSASMTTTPGLTMRMLWSAVGAFSRDSEKRSASRSSGPRSTRLALSSTR